jgi:hypothetical protein
LGWGSDAAVAFAEATRTAETSASGWGKFASEAACAGRTANDRRTIRTAGDRTGFSGRTNANEAEIGRGD